MANDFVVPIEELKAVASCEQAPPDALLQVRGNAEIPVFAMRCEMRYGSTPSPCLLILSGSDRGLIVEGGSALRPGLDVSAFSRPAVKDPFPVQFTQDHYELAGIVCESGAGSGLFFVRGRLASNTRAYVWLRELNASVPVGAVVTDKPDDMWVLGFTEVVKKPPDPIV